MIGGFGKSDPQSFLLEIMFQFLIISFLMSGFMGLKLVTVTGVVFTGLSLISSRLSSLYLSACLKCFFFKFISGYPLLG